MTGDPFSFRLGLGRRRGVTYHGVVRRDERVEDPGQAQVRVVGEEGLRVCVCVT